MRAGAALVRLRTLLLSGAFVGLVLFCASSNLSAQQQNDVFFQKSGWTGFVLRSGGQSFGCAAGAKIDARLYLHVVHFSDLRKWKLVFDRPSEFGRPRGFAKNRQWRMELVVDGVTVHSGTTFVDQSGLAILEPELTTSALRALSRGEQLEIITERGRFQYSLAGSADAIEAAANCVRYLASATTPETGSLQGRREEPSLSSGTGFFVSWGGEILTNHHVVRNCQSIHAGLPGAQMQSASLVALDPNNDLALLRSAIRPTQVPGLRIGVRTGEGIAVYGFPLAGLLPSTGNFTLGNITATAGLRDDSRILQISAPVQYGNSGGPLLDQHGNVVGIVVGKINALMAGRALGDIPQNVNFAIKATTAISFLEAHHVRAESSRQDFVLAPPDLADRARRFTVFIICQR